MVIFPREPHSCVRNDATGPQGSESPFSLIPKGFIYLPPTDPYISSWRKVNEKEFYYDHNTSEQVFYAVSNENLWDVDGAHWSFHLRRHKRFVR